MHPMKPQIVGKNLIDYKDVNGKLVIKELIDAAKTKDGDFVYYNWHRPNSNSNEINKVSFAMGIQDWKWMIGGGLYIDDIEQSLLIKQNRFEEKIKNELIVLFVIISILMIILFIIIKWFNKKTKESIQNMLEFFTQASKKNIHLDEKEIYFKEFISLAQVINTMIDFRIKTEQNLINSQKEVQKQKEELETIFENSKDGLAIVDLKSNFLDCNSEYLKITGFTKDELLATSSLDLTSSHDKKNVENILKEVVDKGYVRNFEKNCIVKGNKNIILNMSLSLMPDHQRIIISTKDVTHLKQLESHNRLNAMGDMISNIAHHWRQPLSVISTSASGIKIKKEFGDISDEELLELCDKIDNSSQFLSKTIDDFNSLIKGDSLKIEFSLIKNIEKLLYLVDATVKSENIQIKLSVQNYINYYGYPNDMIQCFMTIINNSIDILKTIKEQKYIFIDIKNDDEKLYIVFKDNGGGIHKDIIPRVFEPYFTTKHQSQGTGIGLYMTHEIIVQHFQGEISVENISFEYKGNSYSGARFTITLPLS